MRNFVATNLLRVCFVAASRTLCFDLTSSCFLLARLLGLQLNVRGWAGFYTVATPTDTCHTAEHRFRSQTPTWNQLIELSACLQTCMATLALWLTDSFMFHVHIGFICRSQLLGRQISGRHAPLAFYNTFPLLTTYLVDEPAFLISPSGPVDCARCALRVLFSLLFSNFLSCLRILLDP